MFKKNTNLAHLVLFNKTLLDNLLMNNKPANSEQLLVRSEKKFYNFFLFRIFTFITRDNLVYC